MPEIPTPSLPVCRMPSPAPWPVTSAEGENTRRYSNGSSKREPSSKSTSRIRDCVRSLMSVGWGMGPGYGAAEEYGALKNVPGQILVADQFAEIVLDIAAIDDDPRAAPVGGVEGHRLEQPLHDGVQPSRADVLGLLVDLEGHLRQALHARVLEGELEPFGRHERGVLAAERGIRLGQNPHEILDHQRF